MNFFKDQPLKIEILIGGILVAVLGLVLFMVTPKAEAYDPGVSTFIYVPMQGDLLDYSTYERSMVNTGVVTSSLFASFDGSDSLQATSTYLIGSFESNNTIAFSTYGGTTSTDTTHIVSAMRLDGQGISAFRIDWNKSTQDLDVWCNGFGTPDVSTTGDLFPAGTWINWAVVMRSNEVRVYKNNSEVASASTTACNIPAGDGNVNPQEYVIGDDGSSGGGNGYWGDLRYYVHDETAWTVSDITSYFADPLPDTADFSMTFPTDGMTTPEFVNWILNVTGTAGLTGTYGVEYGQNSSTPVYQDVCNISNGISNCISEDNLIISKSRFLIPLSYTTSTWYARPYFLEYLGSETPPELHEGNQIDFSVIQTSTRPNASSEILFLAGIFNDLTSATSTNVWKCETPQGITDVGGGISYGLCRAGQFLFVPSNMSRNYMVSNWEQFKGTFPFSIVYTITDSVSAAATTTANTTTTTLTIPGLNNSSFVLLSSSTLEQAIGSSTKSTAFSYMESFIWLLAGATIIAMIL